MQAHGQPARRPRPASKLISLTLQPGTKPASIPMLYLEVEAGGERFALPLETIGGVVRAVAITPLAGAPRAVLGVINVHGEVLPVLSLRRLAGLEERRVRVSDRLVLVRLSQRSLALLVDGVRAPRAIEAGDLRQDALITPPLRGILPLQDGLLLVEEPERFLSPDDEAHLDAALQGPNEES